MARLRKAYAEGGALGYWRAQLAEVLKGGEANDTKTLNMATLYARIGEREKALSYVERALKERQSDLIFLNVEPYFSDLKKEPRFQAVARQVGIPSQA